MEGIRFRSNAENIAWARERAYANQANLAYGTEAYEAFKAAEADAASELRAKIMASMKGVEK
jgi:hypothetical protein